MKKNPFIWFQLKMVKRWPVMNALIFLSVIALAFFIKDYFMFLISAMFITLQMNITNNNLYFLNIENEIVFSTPFSPQSIIQKQSFAIWLKSNLIIVVGFVIQISLHKNYLFKSITFLIGIIFLAYFMCTIVLSILSWVKHKSRNVLIYFSMTIIIFVLLIVDAIVFQNHIVAVSIIVLISLIVSNAFLKRVTFEKIVRGGFKK